jgi:hypothetical protein
MQQLTLQFEGYADSRPVIDVGTTKKCSKVFTSVLARVKALVPSVILFGQALACVSFCFALMFLAAILQG